MEEESDILPPNEFGRRVDGGVDRISQLPDEILFVILSFLKLREAAATSVLSSRWLDLWKHIPYLKFDRISQLPNQIIAVILSFLSLKEAAATSALSSRWSDLWKHTPNLDFDEEILTSHYDYLDSDDDDDGLWAAERYKYIETVNSVMQSHKALSLEKFRISLRVKKSDKCAVTNWLKFVVSRQVESLELDFGYCYEDSNLVVLEESLREESIICRAPETLIFFQSLKRLCLKWLKVSGEDIELFVQNCPLLEQLMIHSGSLTSDVQLCGANLMLKHLEICPDMPPNSQITKALSIKVSAPNLTRIKFSESAGMLSFENVPKLVEADFILKGSLYDIQHFASAASCYLSQLQSLELSLSRPKLFWMSGFPKMPNLKKLVILNKEIYKHNLLPVAAVIWAFPSLEEIKIKFSGAHRDPSAWMEGLTNVERSPHQHLKVFAFRASRRRYMGISDHVVELVSYILDNCVALQKIIIGSPLYEGISFNGERVHRGEITAEMQADADNFMQQLQAKVPNHIQLELPFFFLAIEYVCV